MVPEKLKTFQDMIFGFRGLKLINALLIKNIQLKQQEKEFRKECILRLLSDLGQVRTYTRGSHDIILACVVS